MKSVTVARVIQGCSQSHPGLRGCGQWNLRPPSGYHDAGVWSTPKNSLSTRGLAEPLLYQGAEISPLVEFYFLPPWYIPEGVVHLSDPLIRHLTRSGISEEEEVENVLFTRRKTLSLRNFKKSLRRGPYVRPLTCVPDWSLQQGGVNNVLPLQVFSRKRAPTLIAEAQRRLKGSKRGDWSFLICWMWLVPSVPMDVRTRSKGNE